VTPFSTPRPNRGEGSRASGARSINQPGISHRLVALLCVGSLAVAACATGGATPISIPPDATASTLPAESGTPEPSPTPEPAATFPLTLSDDQTVDVVLPKQPEKIVSLTPAATEILFAIGAGDRTVGKVEDIFAFPPAANDVPIVATYQGVDVEKIIDLGADLVIADANGLTPQTAIDQLRRANIPVLAIYAPTVDGVLDDIELVGDAVGEGPAARDLTASMRAGFDQVAAATQGLPKPRTFYEIDATKEIYGPQKDSFIEAMVDLAGGTAITAEAGAPDIPLEKLVAADPEIIVLGDAAYGTTPEIVAKRPGWGTMTAVKNGAIRPADDVVITRPGPRLVEGLMNLAIAIHPELATAFPTPVPAESPDASPLPSAS
jgi:iron complex transport system substrate-binding protein